MAITTLRESMQLLEKPVILPYAGCKKTLGIHETVLTREDMTGFGAWYKLVHKGLQAELGEKDFVSTKSYYKFFFLSLGLLDFPVVLIGGKRGNGKSLIASFITYCFVNLFEKVATMEKPPPDPTKFGKINYLHDQSYVDDIILGLAYLDKVERMSGARPTEIELMKCILYKAVFWCDEAHMWGEMSRTYQLTVLVNRLIMIARHLYMAMLFSYVDIERANKLIKPYATHVIICGKDWFPSKYPRGTCSFQIADIREGGTNLSKFIHLNPIDWLDLWDSYNIPSVVRDVEIYLGGNSKRKAKAPEIDMEAAAAMIESKRQKSFSAGG